MGLNSFSLLRQLHLLNTNAREDLSCSRYKVQPVIFTDLGSAAGLKNEVGEMQKSFEKELELYRDLEAKGEREESYSVLNERCFGKGIFKGNVLPNWDSEKKKLARGKIETSATFLWGRG